MTDDIAALDPNTTAPTPDASLPPPVNETPPDFNPFADDKGEQSLTAAPTPLMERMRLHFKESQTKGTIFGALRHFGEAAVERGANARGSPSDLENEAIDSSVKVRADLESYDRMPGSEGFLDYGAAMVGSLAGSMTSPESLIGNAFKIPYLAGKGVVGRMAEFGVNQAFVQTAADPWIQSLNIASDDGTRNSYDLAQTFLEKPIGGFVGGTLLKGAHELGTALFVVPQAEKDALTFFRLLRDHGGADEQKRWPEIFNEVQGKSDRELSDMAKEVAADDKAAGDKAKESPTEPATPDEQVAASKTVADIRADAEHQDTFFQERGITHDEVMAMPDEAQAALHNEYETWAADHPAPDARVVEQASIEKSVPDITTATPRTESDAIGDVLAAHSNDNKLDIAMRPQEGGVARESESTRSNLTSNLVEAPNIRKMWTDLANEVGATVRAGRLIGNRAAGQYFTRTGVIRMRQLDDPAILAHEIGHHIEIEYGKPLQDIIFGRAAVRSVFGGAELDNISYYAKSFVNNPPLRRKEGFAEFFRLLIEHPAEADRRAPNFMQDFKRFLNEEPELRATIEKAQRAFDDYRTVNAEDLVDANIHTSAEPRGWAKLRKDVRNNGFWNTITERGSQVYTGLLDENNALEVAVRGLLKTQKDNTGRLINLIAADDPYKLIRLATNAHQGGMIDLMHGVTPYRSNRPEGPSIYDAIALATGKPNILSGWDDEAVNAFSGYLIARRGVFEWERRAAGVHKNDPMPLPKDVYEKKIEVYEKDNPNAQAAADMVHTWTRNLLKKEFDAGLIERDAYNNALKVRDYVPLLRDMSDKSNTGGSETFDAANVGLKQFRGSARPIIDPLESLMERSFRTAQLIAHNDAINALATLADKAGVGGGKLVERIPSSEIKARFVDPLEALRKGLQENGVFKDDADLAISNMLNDLKVNEQDMGPVAIFRSQQASERGENIVFHLVGGELKALRLKEGDFGKELIMSLTGGLSQPLRDWNLQGMAKVSAVLRAGVTTSPDFFITNMLRDQMATWILNRGTFPLVNSIRGIWREITNSELSRTYARMGGIAGGANLNAIDHARVDKDIQSLASKGFTVARLANFEGIFKIIELSETSSRVGLFEVSYKRALKQGMSPYQASVEAAFSANDNLDFGRHGSRIGNTLKLIPFLNAQLQGLDKATRTLVSPLFKDALTLQDKEAQKTMLSAYAKIATLTGLSMALRANYIDDPEYSEISPYMRNVHWMVRIPGLKGNKVVDAFGRTVEVPPGLQSIWLAIPKPFELAILPNLGERAVEMLHNHDPQALYRWATGALDLVSAKTMMSSIGIKAAAEMISGKDFFTGRDIVPEHLQGLEPWAQATAGTSALAKFIGKTADKVEKSLGMDGGGLSPMYVDQLIKGVGGSQSKTILSLIDMATGTKGDQSLADTPIAQRVFKEAYRGSTSTTEFWNQVSDKNGALAQAANTYSSLLSNPAAAANYVAQLPPDKRVFVIMTKSEFPADQKDLHPLVNAHKAMTAISTLKREISDRTMIGSATQEPIELSSSEQRVALDALSRIGMWTARNAMITSGAAALKGQKPGAIDAEFEALRAAVPSVYDELAQRYANAKVLKAAAIAGSWDEVKQTVIEDGSDAKLSNIAHDVARQGFELDERRDKKKKVRPVIPGTLN